MSGQIRASATGISLISCIQFFLRGVKFFWVPLETFLLSDKYKWFAISNLIDLFHEVHYLVQEEENYVSVHF